jgi:hypothetical protein
MYERSYFVATYIGGGCTCIAGNSFLDPDIRVVRVAQDSGGAFSIGIHESGNKAKEVPSP